MNKKNKKEMGKGRRGRLVGLLVPVLFALVFGSIGISALGSLTSMLHTAWMARSWQAVPAEVLESRLHTPSDSDGATYAVRARYRYEWAGHPYESTRVGLAGGNGGDNFDDWHHVWDARLRAAREGGTPIQAWVDPLHPERVVLDRQVRGRQLLFTLPFAILFPLVAIGACYWAWASLKRTEPAEALSITAPRHVPQHNAVGLWLIASIMSVMALPAVGMAAAPSSPAWTGLIAALFMFAALALLWAALQATRRAWIYRGTYASFQPAQPRAGAAFQALWALPPRAAAHCTPQTAIQLRVAQYRIDNSGSDTSERQVEYFVQQALHHPSPEGGLHLQARFGLPADAPSQGARRAGERVDWRLEWLDETGSVLMAVPIPVQASAPDEDSPADRLSNPAAPIKHAMPPAAADDAMPPLPAGVSLQEGAAALRLSFNQRGWRWFGGVLLIALLVAFTLSMPWLEAFLLALALHAFSRLRTLEVRDDGLVLERVSWIWRRRIGLPPSSLRGLYLQERHHAGTGQNTKELWARGVDRGSDLQLTHGYPEGGAAAIGQMLRWALVQRGGRFSPGELRDGPAPLSRPGWGWLICLLWLAVRLSMA